MPKTMIKLSLLEQAYKQAFHKATPHHEVNFPLIQQLTGEKDPEVVMALVYLEHKNTGYDDILERYLCNVGREKLAFQIDLLPGFIKE
jgi:hypothetical protein